MVPATGIPSHNAAPPAVAAPLRVLGIDPGSHNLGWGVVERHGNRFHHVASGTLKGRGTGFVPRMCGLIEGLEDVVVRYRPASCAVETAFTGKNMHSALVLGQARGAVLVALGRAGLLAVEYTPGQIKQAATGRGQADKAQVQGMVRLLLQLGDAPLGLDTSDALACALCHAQQSTWRAASLPPAPRRPSAGLRAASRTGPRAMIARLHGVLLEREVHGVVVDCQGVGYALSCSLTTLSMLPAVGTPVTLQVYTHVAEDALKLYGFAVPAERRTFVALLGAAGVGPKLALAILSTLSPGELHDAVERRDKSALTRIPGVGGKKAERLLLELQGKLAGELPVAPRKGTALGAAEGMLTDLRSALANLGFAREIAERAAKEAMQAAAPGSDLAALVRVALRSTRQSHKQAPS